MDRITKDWFEMFEKNYDYFTTKLQDSIEELEKKCHDENVWNELYEELQIKQKEMIKFNEDRLNAIKEIAKRNTKK